MIDEPTIDGGHLREIAARASTIDERIAGLVVPAPAPTLEDRACAERRLATWRAAAAAGDAARFGRRLAADGIDEPAALRLLGAVMLPAGAALPGWAETLAWVAAAIMAGPAADERADAAPSPVAALLQPGVAAAVLRLRARAGAGLEHALAPPARAALARSLLRRLEDACAPALRAERALFRLSAQGPPGRVPVAAADTSDAAFVRHCRRTLPALLRARPVLGRIVGTIVRHWLDACAELVERLERDLPALGAAFGGGAPLGRVTTIAADVSDPHRGGRGVVLLGFETGRRIVYKPRDLAADAAWASLSRWLAANAAPVAVAAAHVLVRDGYGWMEHVEPDPPAADGGGAAHHRRAGALLALLHLLGASDVHRDNVRTRAGAPAVIDLETLLHPRLARALLALPPDAATAAAVELLADSVLAVEYLPVRVRAPGARSEEMGGMAAMLPPIAGLPQAADAIAAGFTESYAFLLRHRERLLAPTGPLRGFDAVRVRAVLASTRDYAIVRDHAARTAHLGDGADWSMHFDALGRQIDLVPPGDFAWRVLAAERHALARLDIPHFAAGSDGRWIEPCDGRRLDACLAAPPRDRLRRRFAAFGAADLARQQLLIRGAVLASVPAGDPPAAAPRATGADASLAAGALAAAHRLAAIVTRAMLRRGDGAAWIGLAPHDGGDRPMVLGTDLDEGIAGVALFLAGMARVTGDAAAHDGAMRATNTLRRLHPAGGGMGGGARAAGICYALVRLAALLGAPALLADAARLGAALPAAWPDAAPRAIATATRCGLAALALHAAGGGTAALDRAARCGDALLAHGVAAADAALDAEAGLVLAKLHAATGERRFRDAALRLLHAPSAAAGGVADPAAAMLARLRMADILGETIDAEAFATQLAGLPPAQGDAVGGGEAGRIELLLAAARHCAREDLRALALPRAADLVARAPGGLALPGGARLRLGWRRGVAGIGYTLLRLHATDALPALLTWD